MTASSNPIDVSAVLEQLQHAEPDLLRSMLTAFVQALMSAEADAVSVRAARTSGVSEANGGSVGKSRPNRP